MKAQYRNLLWILAIALLAFQLGFKPLGVARDYTLSELGTATYVFPTQDIVSTIQEARAEASDEEAEAEEPDEPATDEASDDTADEEAAVDEDEADTADADEEATSDSGTDEPATDDDETTGDEEATDETPELEENGEEEPEQIISDVELEGEIWDALDEAGVWVLNGGVEVGASQMDVTFAFPVDTPQEEALEQRRMAREVLEREYADVLGAPTEEAISEEEAAIRESVVFQLWKLQVRQPTAQVQLGLDLQGGTRLVMEAVPITRYVFVDQAQVLNIEALEPEESEEPEAAETENTEDADDAAETEAEEEEAADEPEEPSEAAQEVTASRARWAAIAEDLGLYLMDQDVSVRTLTPTTTGLVLEAKTVDQEEADALRDDVRGYLAQQVPAGEIRVTEQESFFIKSDTIERVREIMQRRVDGFGLTEPIIQTQGDRRIIVEIPGTTPENIEDVLDEPADLKLMWFDPGRFEIEYEEIPPQERDPRRPEKSERVVIIDATTQERVDDEIAINDPSSRIVVKGSQMRDTSSATPGAAGDWEVSFELKPDAAADFREFTARHIQDPMPIVLNNVIESAPVIQSTIGAHGRITGGFSLEEANNLKTLLNAGALPVPLEVVENREVSPTLGQHNVDRSVIAALIGLLAVFIYMLAVYRLPGLVANVALTIYSGIVLGVLVMFGATLTLTGIAGLILGIGMAVDANILIFERMKEELRSKSLGMAVRVGFERAWTAILDSNVTTLLAGFTLWMFGTGGIKGFATTLIVSVLASMFSAVFVSRVLLEIVVASPLGKYSSLYLGARPESIMKEEPRRGRSAQ
ncbi:MAG: protein translocase subunit SecD [Armatimonadia bacterium]|nr:protein translocase subunit SecD [Armatimonadia bacterium]